jgi:predicted dehydrogenase
MTRPGTAVRWGIVGPGRISERFVAAMTHVPEGAIVAVASRDAGRAQAFADRFGIERSFGDYRSLVDDPDVDAVYVGVPHSGHAAVTVAALEAGKSVLCEKPMALDAGEVRTMIDTVRTANRFLMEAVWSRYLPSYRKLRELLGSGRVGTPQLVDSDFGFRLPVMPEHRLFDARLGGGATLDLGIYPLQLASFVLGRPERVGAVGAIGTTGVDEVVAFTTQHPDGAVGVGRASIRLNLPCTGRVVGERGSIELPAFAHDARALTVRDGDGVEHIDCNYEGDGLQFEIREVHRCLAEGRLESDGMPLDESLALAVAMDAIRADVGVVYPRTD